MQWHIGGCLFRRIVCRTREREQGKVGLLHASYILITNNIETRVYHDINTTAISYKPFRSVVPNTTGRAAFSVPEYCGRRLKVFLQYN